MTAIGWNGVLLAEAARIAPSGRAGEATGMIATLFAMAMVVAPTAFAGLVSATGSYLVGFAACGVMAGFGALALALRPRDLTVAAE
jgi:MFS-type transporter involved in bile tolerance (Atg22 family)